MDITVVGPDDYQDVAAFMAAFPGVKARSVAAWLDRLRAWWDLNPAFEDGFPRGWMLRDGAAIGGFFGSLPLRMRLGGQETTAFAATSWRVLPAHRGASLALKMRQLRAHPDALHFSTTPLEALVPLLTRLAYQPIERGPGTERQSQFILDGEKFWRARLRDRPFGTLAAKLGGPAMAVAQGLRTRALAAGARHDVRDLPRADESFDALWSRTRTRWANTNVRTAAMVNWYCFAMRAGDKKLLASFDRGTLRGYLVLLVKEDPGRKFAECVDLWMDPAADEAAVLAGLVAEATACGRREGFDRVLFPHFDPRTAALYGGLGLLVGPAWRKREYVKGPPHLMQSIAAEPSYFVRAQGDYGM